MPILAAVLAENDSLNLSQSVHKLLYQFHLIYADDLKFVVYRLYAMF